MLDCDWSSDVCSSDLALLRADHERFGKLIRSAGIKIE
jgi:hypothetical protein